MAADPKRPALAIDDMRNPAAAYDQITPHGGHTLSWILKEDKEMPASALRPMSARGGGGFTQAVQKRFGASDQGQFAPDELMQFVRRCLDALGPDEREEFLV